MRLCVSGNYLHIKQAFTPFKPVTLPFFPLRRLLNDEAMVPMHPWYRGFTGSITEIVPTRARCEVWGGGR